MNTGTYLVAGLLLTLTARAQDTIPLYSDVLARLAPAPARPAVGLDLFSAYWLVAPGIGDNAPTYVRPLSATIYLPLSVRPNQAQASRRLYVNAGYLAYGGTLQRTIYQQGGSLHLRAGVEIEQSGFLWGYGGLVSGWLGEASVVFGGTYFGSYRERIGPRRGVAVGTEAHGGLVLPVSKRLSVRPAIRLSVLVRTVNGENLPPPRLSGVEWTIFSSTMMLGLNPQLNLVFRL